MPNNWCRNIVLLYRRDLITGCKEVVGVFTSIASAKKYRRNKFNSEVLQAGVEFQEMFPVEKRLVTIQSEV